MVNFATPQQPPAEEAVPSTAEFPFLTAILKYLNGVDEIYTLEVNFLYSSPTAGVFDTSPSLNQLFESALLVTSSLLEAQSVMSLGLVLPVPLVIYSNMTECTSFPNLTSNGVP